MFDDSDETKDKRQERKETKQNIYLYKENVVGYQ